MVKQTAGRDALVLRAHGRHPDGSPHLRRGRVRALSPGAVPGRHHERHNCAQNFPKADARDAGLRLVKTGKGKSPRLGAILATSI